MTVGVALIEFGDTPIHDLQAGRGLSPADMDGLCV